MKIRNQHVITRFFLRLEEGQDIDSQVLLTEMGIAEANNVSRRQCVVTSIQPIQKLEA
jgi:hypothetical protein